MPEDPAVRDDGFEAFVREYHAPLVGFLARRCGEEDARDIAQESLVRLMRYRGLPTEKLKLLMYRIALNALLDSGRQQTSRQAGAHVSLDADFDRLPSADVSHEERVGHQQELERVRSAILRLPDRCREIYLLNRIEGMSYTEIARHCRISVGAVEKNISRALHLLRIHLQRPAQGEGA